MLFFISCMGEVVCTSSGLYIMPNVLVVGEGASKCFKMPSFSPPLPYLYAKKKGGERDDRNSQYIPPVHLSIFN